MAPLLITAAVSLTIAVVLGRHVRRRWRDSGALVDRLITPSEVPGLPYNEDEECR